jgi:cytochrome c oxidase subunit 2
MSLRLISALSTLVIGGALSFNAMADATEKGLGMAKPWQTHFQEAVTPTMKQLVGLYDYVTAIAIAVTILVVILLGYTCFKFSAKRNPKPSKTTHNTLVEVIWTIVPIIILVSIAIPSIRLHYFMGVVKDPEMTLKVTGYQWYWGYEYPESGISYMSYIKKDADLKQGEPRLLTTDAPVVVPVDTVVRVQLTSSDVIHSWAMSSFGVKTDAVPGRLNETWFKVEKPGVYYGQCSELCGPQHGFMPIELHAVPKDVYKQWVERAKTGNFAIADLEAASPDAPLPVLPAATKPEATTTPAVNAEKAPAAKK